MWAGRNASQYGSAADIDPTSGAKPAAAARGFSQTTARARRCALAITAASSSGGSLSQPSEAMTSTPPRTTLPCRDRSSSARQRARWVPPNRSTTCEPACATAADGDRCASAGVSRVSDVENAKVSACRVRAKTRIRCRYAVA